MEIYRDWCNVWVDDSLRGGRGEPGLTVKTEAKYLFKNFCLFQIHGLCEYCPHAGGHGGIL